MTDLEKALELPNATETLIAIGDILLGKPGEEDDYLSGLTEKEKVFQCVEMLQAQVNNGGFDQFFFNSSGNYAHEVASACRTIEAIKTADLVDKAIALFPVLPIPKDIEVRRKVMDKVTEEISDLWSELDNQFYKQDENIDELLIQYVKNNLEEFSS